MGWLSRVVGVIVLAFSLLIGAMAVHDEFRHWFFSVIFTLISKSGGEKTLPYRRKLTEDIGAGSTVFEIGAGSGGNTKDLPQDITYITAEPNKYFADALHEAVQSRGFTDAEVVVGLTAEEWLDSQPAASLDVALAFHVLCTVEDPSVLLHKLHRVLKDDGKLYFLEHVAHEDPFWNSVQGWVQPLWEIVGDGCQLRRETGRIIEQNGFNADYENVELDLPRLIRQHHVGVATKKLDA